VLRLPIESGHAVSLASIAEHPINKIPAGASTLSESPGMNYSCIKLSLYHQLLVQKQI
jgi:hypothetical protein